MIIGIDLGTTNSAMAIWDSGEPRIIPNAFGNRLTPSVVSFSDTGEVLVGEPARNQSVIHSDRTVVRVKRSIGTETVFTINGNSYSPEEISAEILRSLKRDAEACLGETVDKAVITVPAHFNDARRKATKEAGRLAGLKVLRIINEPTAASLAVCTDSAGAERIVIYDLGGGTFDVTCLERRGDEYHVLSSDGESFLGGIEFDRLISRGVIESFEAQTGTVLRRDPVMMQMILDMTERAKIELSNRDSATISIPFFQSADTPVHLRHTVKRAEFEELIEPYLVRTLERIRNTIRAAGWKNGEIDRLVFSGGSSRIPVIRSRVSRELGVPRASRINPDEVVALGAAVQARILQTGGFKKLYDVSPTHLGVEIEQDGVSVLIPRNTRLPVTESRIFTTVSHRQNAVEIHVVEGDQDRASCNASLGRFVLSGIRDGSRGEPRIEVVFKIDEDGILGVQAKDLDTGVGERIAVVPTRDHAGIAASDAGTRLVSLIHRVEVLTDTESVRTTEWHDPGFMEEIRDVIAVAHRAMSQGNPEGIRDAEIALQTVLQELHVMFQVAEAGYAGA
jgi:molecular chaperone DnaK